MAESTTSPAADMTNTATIDKTKPFAAAESLAGTWLSHAILGRFPDRRTIIEGWQEHSPFASAIISVLRPGVFVELGTHRGDSYCAFCEAIALTGLATKAFAIDTWSGDDHAGTYESDILEDLRAYHDHRYGHFSKLVQARFDEAVGQFPANSIDLLHIDGLHTEEAVRYDFETYRDRLSDRAVVLFHDTQARHEDFGVYKVWRDLASKYPAFEFTHSSGLGVLMVGSQVPQELLWLCHAPESEQRLVRDVFSALGRAVRFQGRSERLWHQVDEAWQRIAQAEHERELFKTAHDEAWQRIAQAEHERELFKTAHDEAWQRIAQAEHERELFKTAHDEAWQRIHSLEEKLAILDKERREATAQKEAWQAFTLPFIRLLDFGHWVLRTGRRRPNAGQTAKHPHDNH